MTKITENEFEILKLGNPILRQTARELTKEEILSSEIQGLIPKMWDVMKNAGGTVSYTHLTLPTTPYV